MKISHIVKIMLVLILFCSGAAIADEGKNESGKRGPRKEMHNDKGGGTSYFHRHGHERLDIPSGHYPGPGECRVWYPDRPAGQQPPPRKCEEVEGQVPPGAWLIHHSRDTEKHVQVLVYDDRRPGQIKAVGEFEIGSGVLVKVVLDKSLEF